MSKRIKDIKKKNLLQRQRKHINFACNAELREREGRKGGVLPVKSSRQLWAGGRIKRLDNAMEEIDQHFKSAERKMTHFQLYKSKLDHWSHTFLLILTFQVYRKKNDTFSTLQVSADIYIWLYVNFEEEKRYILVCIMAFNLPLYFLYIIVSL